MRSISTKKNRFSGVAMTSDDSILIATTDGGQIQTYDALTGDSLRTILTEYTADFNPVLNIPSIYLKPFDRRLLIQNYRHRLIFLALLLYLGFVLVLKLKLFHRVFLRIRETIQA